MQFPLVLVRYADITNKFLSQHDCCWADCPAWLGPGAQEAGERAEEGGCEQGKRLEEKVPPSKKAKME